MYELGVVYRNIQRADRAAADGFEATDTAGCLEHYPQVGVVEMVAVPSGPENLKVTFAEDVALVTGLLRGLLAQRSAGTGPDGR